MGSTYLLSSLFFYSVCVSRVRMINVCSITIDNKGNHCIYTSLFNFPEWFKRGDPFYNMTALLNAHNCFLKMCLAFLGLLVLWIFFCWMWCWNIWDISSAATTKFNGEGLSESESNTVTIIPATAEEGDTVVSQHVTLLLLYYHQCYVNRYCSFHSNIYSSSGSSLVLV